MKKFCLCLVIGLILFSCDSSEKITGSKACIIAQEFVKEKLSYPETADFESLNYVWEPIAGSENHGTLYQKFTTKNGFGVPTEYIYKIEISYNGGEWTDESNWSYDYLIIEEVNSGEQYKYIDEKQLLSKVEDAYTETYDEQLLPKVEDAYTEAYDEQNTGNIKILNYDCCIVTQTEYFLRVCTPVKLTQSEVKQWLETFDNNRVIYFSMSKTGPENDYIHVYEYNQIVAFDE